MKRVLCFFAVVIAVFALSFDAVAQPGGGRGMGPGGGMGGGMMGGMGGLLQVVQNPELHKMIDLTPDQLAAITTVGLEAFGQMRGTMPQQGGGMPSPDQMREQRQRMGQMIDSTMAKVDEILRPEQRVKLRQVSFQLAGGLNALGTMPSFVGVRALEALELTPAQKEQITSAMEKRDAEIEALGQGFNFREATQEERAKFQADREAITRKYSDQITASLAPEQKAKADNLTQEAPALRETLGLPEPGPQRGPQRRGDGAGSPGGGFTPSADSWRPGQSTTTPPAGEQQRRPRRASE